MRLDDPKKKKRKKKKISACEWREGERVPKAR